MTKTTTKIVVLPDIHTPNHNQNAIKPVLSFIKFYKPDILIQLGDFCDWDSLSTYDVSSECDIVTIDREVSEANYVLDAIDNACQEKCRKIMLGGNHEKRYPKYKVNQGSEVEKRKLREFSTWALEYNLYSRGWEYFDYGKNLQIGKIVFTHGWFSSGNAAKKMSECFPGRNVIYGHTHKHEVYGTIDERGLPIEAESIGTLSNFDLSYLNGKPATNWVNGFLWIDVLADGTFTKHFVNIICGRFVAYGKVFTNL
jgi:predicted phosphodiesterase